jgi:hypothetical protein
MIQSNAVIGDGHLPTGTAIHTKPFQMAALGSSIHRLLER